MPRLLELSGLPPNPDCLHCMLAAPIEAFLEAHPEQSLVQAFGAIVHIAADYAASCVPEREQPMFTAGVHQLVDRLLTETFAGANAFRRKRQ